MVYKDPSDPTWDEVHEVRVRVTAQVATGGTMRPARPADLKLTWNGVKIPSGRELSESAPPRVEWVVPSDRYKGSGTNTVEVSGSSFHLASPRGFLGVEDAPLQVLLLDREGAIRTGDLEVIVK